jgi:hypothetical protein
MTGACQPCLRSESLITVHATAAAIACYWSLSQRAVVRFGGDSFIEAISFNKPAGS